MPAIDSMQNLETDLFSLATIATDATSAVTVDTFGKGAFAMVDCAHSPATNTSSSAKFTTIKLQHGTTTHPTNCTNIAGMVGTTNDTATTNQFVLGVHNDTANWGITRFFVNLVKKERILRIERQAAASHHTVITSITYFRKPQSSNTAAKRGCVSSVVG